MSVTRQIIAVLAIALVFPACNFFGKKKDESGAIPPAQLESGQVISGVWTRIWAGTATNNNPTSAYVETYWFDPNGGGKIELKDPHVAGVNCTGWGTYRTVGNDVFFYIQAVNNSICGFASPIRFSNVSVGSDTMYYHDNNYDSDFVLYRDKTPLYAGPVGLWNFAGAGSDQNGDGGFDWMFFSDYGYMVMQTHYGSEYYLLTGYYAISTGGAVTVTFMDGTPGNQIGTMTFTSFVTNGSALVLTEPDGNGGTYSYSGTRL